MCIRDRNVSDTDSAIWRRIIRVPFENSVRPEDRDPKLKSYLRDPQGGGQAVLNWMIQGALEYQRDGLMIPDSIRQATDDYRHSQDPLADFLEQEVDFDYLGFVSVVELREAYENHCRQTGQKYPLGPREFNRRLRARGCEVRTMRYRTAGRLEKVGKCWVGLTLHRNPDYVSSR